MKKRATAAEKRELAQLRASTRQYDRELPIGEDGLPGRPLNSSERKEWNKVRKKMGRPRIGKGVKRVMISVEKDLLKSADSFAMKKGLTRAGLISESLRAYIAGAA